MKLQAMFRDVRRTRYGLFERLRRRYVRMTALPLAKWMSVRNRLSSSPLVEDSDLPVVSMTTHGGRLQRAALAIESIGRGKSKPSRFVLWIDDAQLFNDLPASIRRCQRRGLEVRMSENFGPHTKYYPLVRDMADGAETEFVTADDDILYPRWWLSGLVRARIKFPGEVLCYRAHRVTASATGVDPYEKWLSVLDSNANPTVFPTGVSGVLYPSKMGQVLRAAGAGFVNSCLSADDVWLHRAALMAGVVARQIVAAPLHFWLIPTSQTGRLMDQNLQGGGNDEALTALYGHRECAKIEASQ